MTNEQMLAYGRQVMQSQPFCQLMETELERLDADLTVMSMPLRPEFTQHHGSAHGGAIGFLADTALAYAAATSLVDVVSNEYKINFLKPAIGDRLVAEATIISAGKRQAVCEAKVYCVAGDERTLTAVAQGTITKAS